MRVNGNNNQFFRTSNTNKGNRLWLNFTSDNGIYSQILVAYDKRASDDYDGIGYDTPKNLSLGASATLYSIIKNESKKFVIQGKGVNSLNNEEIINIGIKTTITIPTIYNLSLAQIEGDFLDNNVIYLKDNLLNVLHDLKTSDYNFTSEVGEFNNRFEIVFSSDALSINQITDKNNLTITEHKNGNVQFKLKSNNSLNNIKIIDLQGRLLYDFYPNSGSKDEILRLTNLSQSAYVAKVTLDNNYVISKKAIKRY